MSNGKPRIFRVLSPVRCRHPNSQHIEKYTALKTTRTPVFWRILNTEYSMTVKSSNKTKKCSQLGVWKDMQGSKRRNPVTEKKLWDWLRHCQLQLPQLWSARVTVASHWRGSRRCSQHGRERCDQTGSWTRRRRQEEEKDGEKLEVFNHEEEEHYGVLNKGLHHRPEY